MTAVILKIGKRKNYFTTLERLILNHDFRLIGDYLRALNTNAELAAYIEGLSCLSSENYHVISYNRFKTWHKLTRQEVQFVNELEAVLHPTSSDYLIIFCPMDEVKKDIMQLIFETQGFLGKYIDSQWDLQGMHALVRKGLVKKWLYPTK